MQSNERKMQRIAIIGFGEAGGIVGSDLVQQGCSVRAYDILVAASPRAALETKARAAGVTLSESLASAIQDAELVISAVTAAAAHEVAVSAAKSIQRSQVFLDINSVSPETKRENARVIEAAGGSYVEAAVMAPVPPQRLQVPMLLGGHSAKVVAEQLRLLGMNANSVSDQVGVASAIKMCRSIMIKGLEALTVECLLAARRYGAEDAVLGSLHASFPNMGWNATLPDYLVSRVAEHGRRRAAEMREVSRTLEDVGVRPLMADAIGQRQDLLVDAMQSVGYAYTSDKKFSWRELADQLVPLNSSTLPAS
jgi:3-hydroxyisobutyrate dehydrogenase-like beta-hydroxyacid dehydrogenase